MIVVIAIVGTIILKTKGIMLEAESSSSNLLDKTKVTILTNDEITDQSWGSLAYKGQLKIEEKYPINVKLYSKVKTEKILDTITEAIENGSKLVIGHGREFSDSFATAAQMNPDVQFVTIHGKAKHPNQAVYTFDQGELEYFAALAASLMTKSNKVAVISPSENQEKNPQFKDGLAYYKPEARYYYKYINDRDDSQHARKLMEELLAEGVDVVYTKANAANRDVIELAKKENIYVIGYLDDQSYMAKDLVLTSVLNDVPQAYLAIMDDYFSEEGIPSGKVMLNESHGVYSLAPYGPMFSKGDLEFIKAEIKRFKNGELKFP